MTSALRTGIAVSVLGLALCGCDQLARMSGAQNNSASNMVQTNTAMASGDKPTAAPATPSDPVLASQIATAATELNARTPMTVDQITTLTGVRAEGTEIVYEMSVSQDIPTAQMEAIRQTAQTANQGNLCRDPNAGRLIRMGASMHHYYTDPSGDRFETHVTSCPPA